MALPSAKRPAVVQEELEEEKERVERDALKVVFKKDELFMRCMITWYEKLGPKEKRRLTKKRLLRRSLYEAHNIRFPIMNLTGDWVQTLIKDHGFVIYKKIKKSKADEKKPSKVIVPGGRAIIPRGVTRTQVISEPQPCSSRSIAVNESTVEAPKREVKKLIDLMNEPPPGWWLQSYAKGVVLPRHLRVYSGDDQNIIFYDYTQNPSDLNETSEGKFVGRPHDKDGIEGKFDWWAEETKKEERAQEWKNYHDAVSSGAVKPYF